MFKSFLLAIALLIASLIPKIEAVAQDNKSLNFNFSLGHAQYKEYLFNGLRNDGIHTSYGIAYLSEKNKFQQVVGFNLDLVPLWNRYGWPSWFFQPSFHYQLLHQIKDKLKIGGQLRYSNLFYSNENYDSQHLYWITPIDFSISATYFQPINPKLALEIPINIPIFGMISRPAKDRNLILNEPDLKVSDILKRLNSNFQFVTFGAKYFEIETGLLLKKTSHHNKSITFGYKLRYTQTATSLKTQLFTNQFYVQLPINQISK